MSQSKKAAKSVFIIIFFTISSKFLGFIREMMIAAKFGSGTETDTFFIALTATSLFSVIITRSINNTMIPLLSEVEANNGKDGKRKHTNNLLNIILLISFVIVVIAWALAPFIIRVLASGFKGDQFKLAVLLMRIGLPSILFASLVGVFRGYLQSEFMFTESAVSNFPFNFVYIFFLMFLSSIYGIKGLMVTSVLAVVAQFIIQIPGISKTGYKYKLVLDFKDRYVKKIVYLVPPILISTAVSDLNKIIDRSLASTLVDGSISALNYANRLDSLTLGIFVSAITTVIYPMLSKSANMDSLDGFKKVLIHGFNFIMLITIPATLGIIVLANPIVKVAFERGAFDSTATYMTAGALVFYSIGLVGTALKSILFIAYFSIQDTKTPMINSFISLVINIILNFTLISFMAHRGLALASSIAEIVSALFLLYKLKKKIGSLGFAKTVRCGLKSLVASIIMGVVVYFLYGILAKNMGSDTISELISLVISVGMGVAVYFILIYILRIEEVDWAIKSIKDRLIKT